MPTKSPPQPASTDSDQISQTGTQAYRDLKDFIAEQFVKYNTTNLDNSENDKQNQESVQLDDEARKQLEVKLTRALIQRFYGGDTLQTLSQGTKAGIERLCPKIAKVTLIRRKEGPIETPQPLDNIDLGEKVKIKAMSNKTQATKANTQKPKPKVEPTPRRVPPIPAPRLSKKPPSKPESIQVQIPVNPAHVSIDAIRARIEILALYCQRDGCNFSASSEDARNKHMKRAHGIERFRCPAPDCDQSFKKS